jgi:chromosome segregation ATPase
VEGRGSATIQEVTVSEISTSPGLKSSPKLEELKSKKQLVKKAISRCQVSYRALTAYMENNASHPTEFGRLEDVLQQYSDVGKKLDKEESDLEKELKDIEADIQKEKKALSGTATDVDPLLKKKVSIGLYAANDASVELVFTYGAFLCKYFFPILIHK